MLVAYLLLFLRIKFITYIKYMHIFVERTEVTHCTIECKV